MSHETDAVTIVVSEETQTVSITVGGGLLRGLDARELKQRLTDLLSPGESRPPRADLGDDD